MSDPKQEAKDKELLAKLEGGLPKRKPLAEVKGPASYRLLAPHYRDGVTYETDQVVTVVDEKPSKKWKRVPYDKKAPLLAKRLSPKEQALLEPEFDEAEFVEPAPAPATGPAKDDGKGKRPNDKQL